MSTAVSILAKRQASEWLLRIREAELAPDERAEFEAWLAGDPNHQAAFTRISGSLNALSDLGADLRIYLSERSEPKRRVAPAMALAVCLLLAVAVGYSALTPPHYSTAIGEQRSIALVDGTRVELNTNTRLEVRFADEERRVVLSRGEAMFEVFSDPARPFIVEADGREVRAVGTAFSVRVQGEGLHVLVVEGIVAVDGPRVDVAAASPDREPPRLIAGQALSIAGTGAQLSTLPDDEVARSLAWRSGMLQFDGQPLGEAVAEVSRHTGVRFVIEDPSVLTIRVWAYFPASDLDGFLSGLELNAPDLSIERSRKNVRIARRS